jgi:hypothetical protein
VSGANPAGTASEPNAIQLVPPTGWGVVQRFRPAARLGTFDGVTIGLLENSKANSAAVLDEMAADLATRYRINGVVRATKPHPSLPVSDDVLDTFAAQVNVVLTAIGD